ncbi:PREDICTED: histone-lysine N-methyltransferase EHMT2 isoform X2 [Nicrophorus vespilloides]|uniref:Histone-lysine N-methyltransferase EHMT2 isoform X2 n=1 Tax=Nicrophorus vespilloides TaxID=110193 RepID=A0ABM1N989_NICVS|nr:PREDICTED: histone-lysine N-methyltransferase EHMT2 isoform X2 [Nicrophorus vespilloides]
MEEESSDSTPCNEEEGTFITKILGEMKTQFNNGSEENSQEEVQKVESEAVTEDTTAVTLGFSKPRKRSKRVKVAIDVNVKRSTRRRSRDYNESILKTAIARKEKSYNESDKPQRLTRQLKPTQKILDNIANAAASKHEKKKRVKGGDGEEKVVKVKSTRRRTKVVEQLVEIKEEIVESDTKLNIELDTKPVLVPQMTATQLCVCSHETKYYVLVENRENVFCTAIDNISNKLIGCNNPVNHKDSSMLRPSVRIPYGVFCSLHRSRMLNHNCCPVCGIFCTQGSFVQCENKHQYHRKCQNSIDEALVCPHCGKPSPTTDIEIIMETSKPPVFLRTQQLSVKSIETSNVKRTNNRESSCESPPMISVEDLKLYNETEMRESGQYSINDLLDCIKKSDYQEVAAILGSRSVDLNSFVECDKDETGTVLHYSARHGLLPIIHMLTIAEDDLDILDSEKNTALMVGVLHEQNDVVKYLTKAGASIIAKGMDGMTALHLAAKCGNLEACEILLSTAAHIKNYIDIADDGGWTPLVWSCEHNHVDIVKYLLSEKANPLLSDVEQNVALHWAAFSGSSKIVEMILNFGGEVNVINSHGDSPLHIAARQDNYNCVLVLLARGAKIDVVNKADETPIECCPENSKSYEALILNIRLQSYIQVDNSTSNCLSNDISEGKERNAISCINSVDDETPPRDYCYVTKNCIMPDIQIDSDTLLVSCSCSGICQSSCDCYKHSNVHMGDSLANDLTGHKVIFECSPSCSCSDEVCTNRVVQKGSKVKFQLFRTRSKGWGVKTLNVIKRGTFVSEYVGQIINEEQADSREDDTYLFDLDNKGTERFSIDAKFYGNVSRFMNHNCRPNLLPIRVFTDHHDVKFPRISLFAKCDIRKNEELSFDYGEKFWAIKKNYFACKCGSDNCIYSERQVKNSVQKC